MLPDSLLDDLLLFRTNREWEQFHTPKNLALSISLEAAELLEIFQWTRHDAEVSLDQKNKIKQEIADLIILISYLAHDLDIPIIESVREKLLINDGKYPVTKSKGRSDKYDAL